MVHVHNTCPLSKLNKSFNHKLYWKQIKFDKFPIKIFIRYKKENSTDTPHEYAIINASIHTYIKK